MKFTKEELFKLIDAGYTKAEISELFEPASNPDPEPDPEPEQVPAAAAEQPENNIPKNSPSEIPMVTTDSYIKQLQDAVKELTAAVHSQNVKNDDSSGRETVRTDSDIIANVIYGGKTK